jgi:hypothetical protein
MRIRLSIAVILLIASGCSEHTASDPLGIVPEDPTDEVRTDYKTLTKPPDEALDKMTPSYPNDFDAFRTQWMGMASAKPLDGQRAIELLEIACYADLMCHTIEYPLRVATLDYIKANTRTADVLDALKWISLSYESDLPLDSPNDESGQMRGILVESMKIRMGDYAEELLNPQIPSQHRK